MIVQRDGDISVYQRVAYALAVIGLPIVHRGTLRALLPAGRSDNVRMVSQRYNLRAAGKSSRKSTNGISEAFGRALKNFERDGFIRRGQEFVLVVDHRALLDRALERFGPHVPPILLALGEAANVITLDIRQAQAKGHTAAYVAQRRRELEAIHRLMTESPASLRHRGRGAYSPVPKPGVPL